MFVYLLTCAKMKNKMPLEILLIHLFIACVIATHHSLARTVENTRIFPISHDRHFNSYICTGNYLQSITVEDV